MLIFHTVWWQFLETKKKTMKINLSYANFYNKINIIYMKQCNVYTLFSKCCNITSTIYSTQVYIVSNNIMHLLWPIDGKYEIICTWSQKFPPKIATSLIFFNRDWNSLSLYSNRIPNTRTQITFDTALFSRIWGSNGLPGNVTTINVKLLSYSLSIPYVFRKY